MYNHVDKPILTDSRQYRNSTSSTDNLLIPSLSQQPPSHLPFVYSPEQFGIPINYPNPQQQFANRPRPKQQLQSNSGPNFGSSDSAVQLSDYTDRNASNELEFCQMNITSNLSPSSSVTSAMDLGFANIGDVQSNDDIDLNNITPSIKLASSLTLLESNNFTGNRQNSSNRRSTGKPLIKSDDLPTNKRLHEFSRATGGGGCDLMPSGSCPDSIRPDSLSYTGRGGNYNSPTSVGLAIPQVTSGGSPSSGAGTWTGGSNITSPSGESMVRVSAGLPLLFTPISGGNQHAAMLRARNKKDSHNRIERKRRDYINCQISELGTLLPEEMFRDTGLAVLESSDCKKNKGSILKNSVDYICALRAENACFSDLRKEANLATNLIPKLVKYIQDLESVLPQDYLSKATLLSELTPQLQEWSSVHDSNLQLQQHASGLSSPALRSAANAGFVSVDTSESSPGMSSIGNEDLGYPETKGDSCSSIPNRSRCTSLSSSGQPIDKIDSGRCLRSGLESANTCFGSLPNSRRLHQLLPTRPPITIAGNTSTSTVTRSMLSPSASSSPFGGGGSLKHPSPSKPGGRQRTTKAMMTKMDEGCSGVGSMSMNTKEPIFSDGGRFSGGLSSSLPVRIASGEFIGGGSVSGNFVSEMESDDICLRLSEPGDNNLATAFKPEPIMDSTPSGYQASSYHRFGTTIEETDFSHQMQQNNWAAASSANNQCPISMGCLRGGNSETSPSMGIGDELQFDAVM